MPKIRLLALAVSFFLSSNAFCAPLTDRINTIPDITQTDPGARFPHGGIHLCGPCAISNSIMWLGNNGYERLLPNAEEQSAIQVELVKLLASPAYMDSTLEWGTSPAAILEGLEKYVRDRGYEYTRLSYQGWRNVPARFHAGSRTPGMEWIESGLRGDSAVWLNVGWYKFSEAKKEYVRIGGHWVTLAGFGVDRDGRAAPGVFIIHDPGSREITSEYIRLEKIRKGTFISGDRRRRNAAGLFKIDGMKIHKDARFGILDGAIRLEMKKPRS